MRLDTYQDPSDAALVVHDHPAEIALMDLQAILHGVQVQERGGLLETPRPPRPVFETGEIMTWSPGLREALKQARSSEWVAFALLRPAGGNIVVTSGALFLKSRHLHMILANDHESVAAESEALAVVRRNPVRPLRSRSGVLTFEAPAMIIASGTNWLGGSAGPSASELVLDHTRFLDRPRVTSPRAVPAPTTELQQLKEQVARLEEEIARLRRQVEMQAQELTRLKSRPRTGSTR